MHLVSSLLVAILGHGSKPWHRVNIKIAGIYGSVHPTNNDNNRFWHTSILAYESSCWGIARPTNLINIDLFWNMLDWLYTNCQEDRTEMNRGKAGNMKDMESVCHPGTTFRHHFLDLLYNFCGIFDHSFRNLWEYNPRIQGINFVQVGYSAALYIYIYILQGLQGAPCVLCNSHWIGVENPQQDDLKWSTTGTIFWAPQPTIETHRWWWM